MVKYVVWTIIGFIIAVAVYGGYDYFKGYLMKKYEYEFYDYGIISLLMYSEIAGSIGICLRFADFPKGLSIVLCTLSVIFTLVVLLSNIVDTDFGAGILTTVLQALLAVFIIVMLSIIGEQLKRMFSPKPD
jgi:hypothetical protein